MEMYRRVPQGKFFLKNNFFEKLAGNGDLRKQIEAEHRRGAVAEVDEAGCARGASDLVKHIPQRADGADAQRRAGGEHHPDGHQIEAEDIDQYAFPPQQERVGFDFHAIPLFRIVCGPSVRPDAAVGVRATYSIT